jgi:hypothetical protein
MAIDPLTAVFDIGGKLIDRLWPDPNQRDAAKLELLKMQQTGELAELTAETELAKAQTEINKIEAASGDKFSSRWRPFIGWTCGVAFAYHFVLQPLLAFVLAANGIIVALPAFDMDALNTVLMGMLGLGGMRTFERVKGVK